MLNETVKQETLKNILNLAIENTDYLYVLDKDILKLKNEYADDVLDHIKNKNLLKKWITSEFSDELFESNNNFYNDILFAVNAVLFKKLDYVYTTNTVNKKEYLVKIFKEEDLYYLYLLELALEGTIEFEIKEEVDEDKNKYLLIKFNFMNYYYLTPEIFILNETYETNLSYISNDTPHKIIEIYTGSTEKELNGVHIYFNKNFISENSKQISELLLTFLNQFSEYKATY